ncbi:hypothetical protein D6D23_05490 [Aureobasidium pullulans]|nr:hypothetical protein D6D23_05490 [Aureobasidium pullulans]
MGLTQPAHKAAAPKTVTISEDAVVALRVIERVSSRGAQHVLGGTIKAITDFDVNVHVIRRNSEVLRAQMTDGSSKAGQNFLLLEEHKAPAVQVILCALHSKYDDWSNSECGKSITRETLHLPVRNLWDVIFSARKLKIEKFRLDAWFELWYEQNAAKTDTKFLLYPCYMFNHAKGFAAATKEMVYDHKRVVEFSVEQHSNLHLPPRVVRRWNLSLSKILTNLDTEQIRGAAGRLKTILGNDLWRPIESLMGASCECKENTLFAFQHALWMTHGFPVDHASQNNSITKILVNLAKFESPKIKTCLICHHEWDSIVWQARRAAWDRFDGLCLDCMDPDQPKFNDKHEDYWRHLTYPMKWDRNCRIKHGEPTWYFSFMGRLDEREQHPMHAKSLKPRPKLR